MMIGTRQSEFTPSLILAIFAVLHTSATSGSAFVSTSSPRPPLPLPSLVVIPSDVVTAEAVALVGWFSAVNWPNNGKLGDDRFSGDDRGARHLLPPLINKWNIRKLVKPQRPLPRDGANENVNLSFGSLKELQLIRPEPMKKNSRRHNHFRNDFFAEKQGIRNGSSFDDHELRETSFQSDAENNTDVGFVNDVTVRSKRKICCNNEGVCRTCLNGVDAEEVVDHYFDFFADIPRSLVDFSILGIEQNEHCNSLDIPLFPVDMKQMFVTPGWIRDVFHLGWCPSVLVTKDLGPNSFPAKLVEVRCLCERKRCSARGTDFRCVPVYKMVATWVRFSKAGSEGKPYSPEMKRVRIGCVCAQRPAQWGGEINSIFALN